MTLLWYYAVTGLLFDIMISIFLAHNPVKFPLANIFSWVEFSFITAYYYKQFRNASRLWLLFASVFLGVTIVYSVIHYSDCFLRFNSVGLALFHLCYIVYTIFGFLKIMSEQKNVFLERSAFFWVNVAFIIYSSGVLLIFLCNQYYNLHNKTAIVKLWPLVCIFNIVKYAFLTGSFRAKEE